MSLDLVCGLCSCHSFFLFFFFCFLDLVLKFSGKMVQIWIWYGLFIHYIVYNNTEACNRSVAEKSRRWINFGTKRPRYEDNK